MRQRQDHVAGHEEAAPGVDEKRREEDQGIGGQGLAAIEDVAEGKAAEVDEFDARLQGRDGLAQQRGPDDVVFERPGNEHGMPGFGPQPQRRGHELAGQLQRLQDAADASAEGGGEDVRLVGLGDVADHHRNPGEDLLGPIDQEMRRRHVHGDDEIHRRGPVAVAQQVGEGLPLRLVAKPGQVQVFGKNLQREGGFLGQRLPQPLLRHLRGRKVQGHGEQDHHPLFAPGRDRGLGGQGDPAARRREKRNPRAAQTGQPEENQAQAFRGKRGGRRPPQGFQACTSQRNLPRRDRLRQTAARSRNLAAVRPRCGLFYSISSRLLPPVRLPHKSSGTTGTRYRNPTAPKTPAKP